MPETGRADYDQMLRVSSIPADEPRFFIRAQDAVSAPTVRAWAALAFKAGASPAIVEQALQQADRMDAWPVKKVADADHLTEAQQKRLAYDLDRRAWNARADEDEEVLLAERRGQALAESRARREREDTARRLKPVLERLRRLQQLAGGAAWSDEELREFEAYVHGGEVVGDLAQALEALPSVGPRLVEPATTPASRAELSHG